MKSNTVEFEQNARRVYTAVKHTFETSDMFHRVRCDDTNFVITAKHGASLIAMGENIKVRVVATGTQSSKVVVESGNQFPLNIFNIGTNKKNVTTLTEYIQNRVYKLCSDEEIRLRPSSFQGRELRFKE